MIYKPPIRRRLREERRQLDLESRQLAAQRLASQLIYLPELLSAKQIAYYIAHENEIDPQRLINALHDQHKLFYLPSMQPNPPHDHMKMMFTRYTPGDPLVNTAWDIPQPHIQPNVSTTIDPQALDLVFVPLVAFDQRCHRLGRGAGLYDRVFEFKNVSHQPPISGATTELHKPILIGLAYEFQKIDDIPLEAWDVPMDLIATEKQIYRR